MASGFRGAEVQISSVEISGNAGTGTKIDFRIQFRNTSTGIVHAWTQHSVEPAVSPEIEAATRQLVQALTKWAETVHFESGGSAGQKGEVRRGIAESFRGEVDPFGETEGQG